jgi:hypothetical protein
MEERFAGLKAILYALSDAAVFLFTKPLGLAILGGALILAAALRLWSALSDRRLAAKAAGEAFGGGAATGVALRELAGMGVKAAGALPALAAIGAALVLLIGLSDATRALDDYVAGRRRLAELTTTVRNLERRYKAIEARIDEVAGGRIKATLSFYAYDKPSVPAKTQSIDIAGRELFIDAIVCNFDYSEIAAGRAVNLAIPFRVFSDEVSESEGIALALLDDKGLPLMYQRSPEELYGIDSGAYEARLGELMAALRSDEAARKAGIVRSLYGNAVHRGVRKGDSFIVWVEQSGGLSVKEPFAF